jgi:hypothetical protein
MADAIQASPLKRSFEAITTLGAMEPGLLSGIKAYRDVLEIFGECATVGSYLEVEKALARAEVRAGIITAQVGNAIAEVCQMESVDLIALRRDGAMVGYGAEDQPMKVVKLPLIR